MGKVLFSVYLSVHTRGEEVPTWDSVVPTLGRRGVPTLNEGGVPTLDGGGVPTLDGEGVLTLDGGGGTYIGQVMPWVVRLLRLTVGGLSCL